MNPTASQPVEATTSCSTAEIQDYLCQLERKKWWHWWNAVLVIMLLLGAIGSFSLPYIIDLLSQMEPSLTVRVLLGIVLITDIYILCQQYLLRAPQKYLTTQIRAVTEHKVRADTLYELAILGPLTRLSDRRFGEKFLRTEIARSEKTGGPLAAALFDLDNFKNINDRHGHSAGDLVLQEFARSLKKATRGSDIAVRLGGDEFLFVLPECPPEMVNLVLFRLTHVHVDLGNEQIAEDLIRCADGALYAHKGAHIV